MTVIYYNKTSHIIETIYEFPGGGAWLIDRSTPKGVDQINLSKGTQGDNKTVVTTQEEAAAYYIANRDKMLEVWTLETENAKGEKTVQTITEGMQPDEKTEFKDAAEAIAKLEADGLTVNEITTSSKKLILMATIQVRSKEAQQMEE